MVTSITQDQRLVSLDNSAQTCHLLFLKRRRVRRRYNSDTELPTELTPSITPLLKYIIIPRMLDAFGPLQWFDWDAVRRHHGTHLPHYEIPGAIYFITFRLCDSLPEEVYTKLASLRTAFIDRNPSPHSEEQEREFRRIYSLPLECCLDSGQGACALRPLDARRILEQILLHFDGERYQLGDYVIMPNHVHLLMRMRLDSNMRIQCRHWKALSARNINHLLGKRGRFWQSEPFDHIVRSPQKLQHCTDYIRNNPRNLRSSDFTLSKGKGFG